MQVIYQSEQFLDKNKDYVVPEQNELLNESKCSFVSNLFPITEESKSAKFNSIGTRFKVNFCYSLTLDPLLFYSFINIISKLLNIKCCFHLGDP